MHQRVVVVSMQLDTQSHTNNQMNYQIINHIIIYTRLNRMERDTYINRVTVLTLVSTVAGVLAVLGHYSFAVIILPIVFVPKYAPIIASQQWMVLAQITLTTFIFGIVDGLCLLDIIPFIKGGLEEPVPMMQIYLCLLTVYHYFQFQLVNNFHHNTLNWHSFLLYHSKPYMIATSFMILQHLIAKYIIGFSYKNGHVLIPFGLALMTIGEGLRVAAFFTCRHNFTHLVRYRRVSGHQLVTNGIYSIFRHPSYTGYFYFSVGGQILMGNFISTLLFAIVLIKFFRDRIEDEEIALTSFFPQYLAYREKTWILIPFVHGPSLSKLSMQYQFQD